ncbi:hypothetical protein BD560DRAFT_444750 [Blakeslea trispora]|nr:hypothetical protein BD560DRAFT_444750 [Blakeslea trispora]
MPIATQKSFRLDTPSLFKTFCEHDDNKMTFFSYDNRVIRGPLEYINHKDAVFNAFFKIDRIQQLCRRRKLFFAHHLHLLPGGKYVRILGIKEKAPMKQTADVTGQKRQYNIPESTWQDILNEHEKDNETLRQEIDELLGNTNRLSKQLKNRFKEFSDQDFSLQIKTAKQGWRTPLNLEPEVAVVQGSDSEEKAGLCCPQIGECMTEMITAARNEIKVYIDGLKADRSRLFLAIQQVKSELADQRYQLYIRRRALNLTKRDQKASRQTRVLQQIMGQPTIAKDEDMQLMGDADTIAKNSTSSGTDNGVVKMTESLPVSIQKYVYHLKLYNRFSALTTTEEQEEEFQPLPSSAVINAEDIDFGSQNLNYRHKLAAKKANDVNLIEAEKVLSEKSISNASSEYFTKKTRDRLCSRERKFANPKSKKKDAKKKGKETQRKNLLMMIGDRGFGIGSRIKQHLRYGGIWKQDLHARYMTVCITNENNASRTCVYCFHKLQHPKQLIQAKGK